MRRRIERNLHDGVQQRLVTLSLKLGGVRDRVPDSLPAIRDDLDQLANVLIETLDELRDLARGVHPAILVEAGLGSALQGLARRSALPVRLQLHADGRLPAESEATAYYVVSEAFANAVKHARASAIDIGVDMDEGMLTVRVSDDGVGGADTSCGSGLTGIRDRVEAVGGTLAVHSPPVPARSSPLACLPEIHSADQRIPASGQAGISGGRGRGLGARPDATRPLRRHRRCESGLPAEENVMDRKAPKAESPLARPCHEAIDHHDPVHEWRVWQLSRLGIPWSLAQTVADQVDWHQVAKLVQHGCPPRLALSIVH